MYFVLKLLICFVLLSFFATWFLLRVLIPQLNRHLLDHPNSRSLHSQPIPRGGGVVFVLVAMFASFFSLLSGHIDSITSLLLIVAPLAFVGFLDDRHNLPASWRYAAQFFISCFIVFLSPFVQGFTISVSSYTWLFFSVLVLLIISVTAIINFTNFMDGLDGLVTGCMALAISSLAISLNAPWPLWSLVGALLSFILWNWSPAKVFMGDVGSTFLGAVFAGLVLQASSWPQAISFLLVATPLLGDAFLCVIRRLIAGQRVFQAHRLHLFQRLYQAGWSHSRVSLIYILATALLALAMLVGGLPWVLGLAVAELLIGVWLDQRFAVHFKLAS